MDYHIAYHLPIYRASITPEEQQRLVLFHRNLSPNKVATKILFRPCSVCHFTVDRWRWRSTTTNTPSRTFRLALPIHLFLRIRVRRHACLARRKSYYSRNRNAFPSAGFLVITSVLITLPFIFRFFLPIEALYPSHHVDGILSSLIATLIPFNAENHTILCLAPETLEQFLICWGNILSLRNH